jgi:sigma-B regulation protein RsbU (phosphoserine phosphatase)
VKTTLPARTEAAASPDFKALYRKVERTLARIERIENVSEMLTSILKTLVQEFRKDLGFAGGRLYQREASDFVLCCVDGMPGQPPLGFRVKGSYEPVRRLVSEGLIVMSEGDPGFDHKIESKIGVTKFAAIAIGEDNSYVMSFTIRGKLLEEHIVYSLNAIRHVINLRLREQRLTGMIAEARLIQESLLPAAAPDFPGYDIAGSSRAAELVGGDIIDYLPLSDNLLGVAIGDASGHGLPAALLARDVVTGLRFGMSADLKIIKAVERLNHVIHRSALSSKFASLFYAELEPSGLLIYCNAGHNPPLLYSGRTFQELRAGGLVLGPNPEARYVRGYAQLFPGDVVVMFSDGVIERDNPREKMFGLERLKNLTKRNAKSTAREIVDRIFEAADEFADGSAPKDDQTVLIVKKT